MSAPKKEAGKTAGHRSRLKSKMLERGASGMSETELLELLLFYVVPRRDCRELAEKLISAFGTVENVILADRAQLAEFGFIKENAFALFGLINELIQRNGIVAAECSLLDEDGLKRYIVELFRDKRNELLYALYFDEAGGYLGRQVVFRGKISNVQFSLRTITEGIIRIGGKLVVLAHNHPSNIPLPSGEDIVSTKRVAALLAANDIDLVDHYIVGDGKAISIFNPK